MKGLNAWRNALLNGHLPEFDSIEVNEGPVNLYSSSNPVWPDKLLSDELCNVCMDLDLPFLTSRHPELVPSVLRGLLELSINYSKRIIKRNIEIDEENDTDSKVEDVNDPKYWENKMYEDDLNWESNTNVDSNEGRLKTFEKKFIIMFSYCTMYIRHMKNLSINDFYFYFFIKINSFTFCYQIELLLLIQTLWHYLLTFVLTSLVFFVFLCFLYFSLFLFSISSQFFTLLQLSYFSCLLNSMYFIIAINHDFALPSHLV